MRELYQRIVPLEVRRRFEKGAKNQSDFLWEVGDVSNSIYQNFLSIEDAPYTAAELWCALGHYSAKSGPRVRRIAEVADKFPLETRQRIEGLYGYWPFGYYEKVAHYDDAKIEGLFDFLRGCREGEYLTPGRRLGVGEFLYIFESQIEGLDKKNIEPCDYAVDLSAVSGRALPFQDILGIGRRLRKGLIEYQDRPVVQRFVGLLDEVMRLAPEVMREAGLNVPVDTKR